MKIGNFFPFLKKVGIFFPENNSKLFHTKNNFGLQTEFLSSQNSLMKNNTKDFDNFE